MSASTPPGAGDASGKIFAEGDPKVLIVYFLAFGIWTAAASNDFICSTWRSVGQTRRRGKFHVALAFIPMIFMSVYVVFQHKTKDYKEMGAALLALAFALLHLGRTFMGLWQLHMFKQWTISSIKSMESLGYKTEIINFDPDESDSDDADDDEDGLHEWFISGLQWVNARVQSKPDRIEHIADKIRVNDTLIDNRLSDVHTVCNLRLLSMEESASVRSEKSVVNVFCYDIGTDSAIYLACLECFSVSYSLGHRACPIQGQGRVLFLGILNQCFSTGQLRLLLKSDGCLKTIPIWIHIR